MVRIGPDYAIAAASYAAVPGVETFRPARSIVRERDFEHFEHLSRRIRFADNRPLEKISDMSGADARARARLDPYRERSEPRRARLGEVCARLGAGEYVVMSHNSAYAPLFANWHASCVDHGIDVRHQTIVFPMDEEAESAARRLGYETFFDPESYGTYGQNENVRFGDRQWIDCLFMKNAVMGDMLALGVDVLLQDVDIVWRRNPIPYLRNKAGIECWDFMFHKGAVHPRFQPLYYNSGFVYARSNEFSRLTWERILDNQRFVYKYQSQQAPIIIVMNTFRERGLRTCGLDPDLFVNGHLIRSDRLNDAGTLHPQAYIVHFNWTDGLQQKLERKRNFGLWYLDDSETKADPATTAKPRGRRNTPHRHHAQCVVSHRLRCIYLALAKNGSTTIRSAMAQLDPDLENQRCHEISEQHWRDYTVFTFLRDPVERALSAYYEVSLRGSDDPAESIFFHRLPSGATRFEAFLDAVETRPWDVHVRSQADLLGLHRIDYWGRVESLPEDLDELFRRLGRAAPRDLGQERARANAAQHSQHVVRAKDLSAEQVVRIRSIYRRDAELIEAANPTQRRTGAGNPEKVRTRAPSWTNPVVRSHRR